MFSLLPDIPWKASRLGRQRGVNYGSAVGGEVMSLTGQVPDYSSAWFRNLMHTEIDLTRLSNPPVIPYYYRDHKHGMSQ
jgi:hypothetical protein